MGTIIDSKNAIKEQEVELKSSVEPKPPISKPIWPRVKQFILKNFLLLGLLTSITVSLAWPLPGAKAASVRSGDYQVISTINIILVFFISGLTLKTSEVKKALKHYKLFLLGCVSILAITPCLGFGIVRIPFQPRSFATGLAIFSVAPTSLAACVVLTTQAKGNAALALLMTVSTNLIGILTVPFFLKAILNDPNVRIRPLDLLSKLLLTILVPTVIGKLLHDLVKVVQKFVAKYRVELGLFSAFNLIMMAWQALSSSRHVLVAQSPGRIFIILAATAAYHAGLLIVHWIGTTCFKVPRNVAIAFIFCTSQRTMPVALSVINLLNVSRDVRGLLAIPCVFTQIWQFLFDGVIANQWAKRTDAIEAAKQREQAAVEQQAA